MLSIFFFFSAGSHYNQAVVLDNGSAIMKLGLAGDRKPRVVQPALYGIPKRYSLQMAGMDNRKDRTYGDGAAMRAGVMQLGNCLCPNINVEILQTDSHAFP